MRKSMLTINGVETKKTIKLVNRSGGDLCFLLSFEAPSNFFPGIKRMIEFNEDELSSAIHSTKGVSCTIGSYDFTCIAGFFVDEFDDVRFGIKATEEFKGETNDYVIMLDKESLSRLVFYLSDINEVLLNSVMSESPSIEYYCDFMTIDTFIPLEAFALLI